MDDVEPSGMRGIVRTCTAAAMALAASCSSSSVNADPRDRLWAVTAAASCPAVAPGLWRSLSDGRLTISELESFEGALSVAARSPVRGQRCAPATLLPTSTRDVVVDDGGEGTITVGPSPTAPSVPIGSGLHMQIGSSTHVVPATR